MMDGVSDVGVVQNEDGLNLDEFELSFDDNFEKLDFYDWKDIDSERSIKFDNSESFMGDFDIESSLASPTSLCFPLKFDDAIPIEKLENIENMKEENDKNSTIDNTYTDEVRKEKYRKNKSLQSRFKVKPGLQYGKKHVVKKLQKIAVERPRCIKGRFTKQTSSVMIVK
jgi:hypothetical protein